MDKKGKVMRPYYGVVQLRMVYPLSEIVPLIEGPSCTHAQPRAHCTHIRISTVHTKHTQFHTRSYTPKRKHTRTANGEAVLDKAVVAAVGLNEVKVFAEQTPKEAAFHEISDG